MTLQESAIRKLDITVRAQKGVEFYRLSISRQTSKPEPSRLDFRPSVLAYGPASGTPGMQSALRLTTLAIGGGEHIAVTTGGQRPFCLHSQPSVIG